MSLGQPLGPSAFNDWFPAFRILVERLARDMDDLLGDEVNIETPALAVELADSAWRWAVENITTVKALAWDEGAFAAFYDPEMRDRVNYPDNPYRGGGSSDALDSSGSEVADALTGLPSVSDKGAVAFADEGPLAPTAGKAEIDHECRHLGAVGIRRATANRDRSTDPKLEREVAIHDPILDQHCSATLTASEADAMFRVWLDGDVSRGLEWLTPTVERIIADRVGSAVAALREGLADDSLEATGVMERALDALTTPTAQSSEQP